MNNRSNTRGELLVWPGVGPIGIDQASISEFESYIKEQFDCKVRFVEDIVRKDGTVDTLIRFIPEGHDGSELIFRMFCVHVNIYPLKMISRYDYDYDSLKKIQNNF